MKTGIVEVSRKQIVAGKDLPDGVYEGTWGGHEVKVSIEGIEYNIETDIGVRTFGMPCVVRIKAGEITIDTPPARCQYCALKATRHWKGEWLCEDHAEKERGNQLRNAVLHHNQALADIQKGFLDSKRPEGEVDF